jgi:AbrB family looped-hinge helix DNA binding protein
MRTTIDTAGRLVVPRVLRSKLGLEKGGEVEIELDGSALRIEPVAGSGLEVEEGLLVIPSVGTPVSIEEMHELIGCRRRLIPSRRNAVGGRRRDRPASVRPRIAPKMAGSPAVRHGPAVCRIFGGEPGPLRRETL